MISPAAFIFDMDGTLVDSVDAHAHAWQRTLAAWGRDVDFMTVRSQIGKGGDQLMPVFLSPETIEADGKAIEKERGELFKRDYLPGIRPFPGVAPLFRRLLDRGQDVAIGSSGKADEVAHYERLLGIEALRLPRTTSADAERSKPHPDIFQAALALLRQPGARVIAVGDSPFDATAALRAGITPVGLRCGGFPDADLEAAGCAALYDDPQDFLRRCDDPPIA